MIVNFKNLKETKQSKSLRNRKCIVCNKTIFKGDSYQFDSFRYDTTIISLYSHLNCKDERSTKEVG